MEFHEYLGAAKKAGATEEMLAEAYKVARFDFRMPSEPFNVDPSLLRLPYEVILVRLRCDESESFFYCNTPKSGAAFIGVQGSTFYKDGGGDMCVFKIFLDGMVGPIDFSGEKWASQVPFRMENEREVIENRAQMLGVFLNVLNAPGQKIEDYVPSPKLNRKRMALGKLPLVSYKTLTIVKPSVATNTSSGGTHASPRLHLRRGHFRLVRAKMVWVRQTIVGDKTKGMVVKDYKVVAA